MLPVRRTGTVGPLVVALHFLGGSARTWDDVAERLTPRGVRVAAIDLPGFGDAAGMAGYSKAEMRDGVIATIEALRADEPDAAWFLAGHSMGGAVSLLVAREALNGRAGLAGLQGLVLCSPSTPGPEPMKESSREQMLENLGHAPETDDGAHAHAAQFIDENTGKFGLDAVAREAAIGEMLRMNRAAFRAWLEHGSKEDGSAEIGVIDLPALVFAGEDEGPLGPDGQREHTLPALPQAELVPLARCGHLSPIERASLVAMRVAEFIAAHADVAPDVGVGERFAGLIAGEHTSAATRAVMDARLKSASSGDIFSVEERRWLRALVEAVVPSPGFDLTARMEAVLAKDEGDGWRPEALPQDAEAWRLGLRSLDAAAEHEHGVGWVALDDARREQLLKKAAAGELDGRSLAGRVHLGETKDLFDSAAMKVWFEEVRGELARQYMADPRTMERVGFTGFADDPAGFTQIRLGDVDERLEGRKR